MMDFQKTPNGIRFLSDISRISKSLEIIAKSVSKEELKSIEVKKGEDSFNELVEKLIKVMKPNLEEHVAWNEASKFLEELFFNEELVLHLLKYSKECE